jgi:hypothetical protein
MGDDIASSRRSDDQLLFIMDQAAEWTVNGRGGIALGLFHCLRDALRAVFRYDAAGHHVFAVCIQPGEAIIIFREQMVRVTSSGDIEPELPRRDAA